MGSCPPVAFQNVTREQFVRLQQLVLEKINVALTADVGSASSDDDTMAISWSFDEAAQLLTLEVTKSPYPCFLVISRIKSFVGSCL